MTLSNPPSQAVAGGHVPAQAAPRAKLSPRRSGQGPAETETLGRGLLRVGPQCSRAVDPNQTAQILFPWNFYVMLSLDFVLWPLHVMEERRALEPQLRVLQFGK